MKKITFKALKVNFTKAEQKMYKFQLSLAKEAYKRHIPVNLRLTNGDVVTPGSFKFFKHIYKLEFWQKNVESVDFMC